MTAQKSVKRGLIVATALVSALALASCSAGGGGGDTTPSPGAPQANKDPYKIGFNDDLSGPIAFAGVTVLAGFETYMDQINSEGGINGHPIEVTALDHRADGATSIANYKQLVDEGALIVAGNSASGAYAATAPLGEEYEVPMIGMASADDFTVTYHPWLFKDNITLIGQVDLMSQAVETKIFPDKKKGLRVAALGLDTVLGPTFFKAIEAQAKKKGWEVVAEELVKPGATDCSAQAAKVVAAKPDIIFGSQTPGDDVVCFNQVKTNGYSGIYLESFSSPGEATHRKLADPNWVGLRLNNWWEDATNPGTKAMLEQAIEFGHIGQFGSFSSEGYVMATAIVSALKACGDDCTPSAVRDGLESQEIIDTAGVGAPSNGYTTGDFGHEFRQGRFYAWDAAQEKSVPYTDWLCVSYHECPDPKK
jgi:ABC-type branched-subunit amino acid transport system substrate-binding protein